jgi:hypothetical protein
MNIGSRHFSPEELKPIYRPVALKGVKSANKFKVGEHDDKHETYRIIIIVVIIISKNMFFQPVVLLWAYCYSKMF